MRLLLLYSFASLKSKKANIKAPLYDPIASVDSSLFFFAELVCSQSFISFTPTRMISYSHSNCVEELSKKETISFLWSLERNWLCAQLNENIFGWLNYGVA